MTPSPAPNRERVLRAATSAFLARGYRSSVDEIARRAGVAKQTVYHHFPSKDLLFKDVARELARRILIELEESPSDLRAGLVAFGEAYRSRALGAAGIATFRTLVPEIPRFKALARSMYEASAGEMVRRLAAVLEREMRAGGLRRDDPKFAAELLLGMLVGHDRIKRLFGVAPARTPGRTEAIVDCFLRAFAK
ncbi:MAG TPA: TetR/AcrR family transcriptional regulator [Burkholderiales bacterium]|nr:TetR/AcrR family transcriptional regulator [Burkholderiales bacterium]